MADFAGQIVLVTGGTKGAGKAISAEFAGRGAHVIVNWFHDQDAAERTVAEIVAAGGSAERLRASVGKPDEVTAMFETVGGRHGRLDVLVNCAARGYFMPAADLSERDWHRAFEVNVHGPRRCARAALPLLAGQHGAVVNVSSIGASFTVDNYSAVGVGKAALEALTRYLAVEFAGYGVRVNAASAGILDSPTTELFPGGDRIRDTVIAGTPLGRLGTLAELARLVVFLASSEAGWITGQTLIADGGLSLGHALLRPDRPRTDTAAVPAAAVPAAVVRAAPPQGRRPPPDRVAVVGMGLVVPGAASPQEFWKLLRTGEPAFGEPPRDRFALSTFWTPDTGEAGRRDRTTTRVGGFVRDPVLHPRARDGAARDDPAATWLRHAIAQACENVHLAGDATVACHIGACVDGNLAFEQAMVAEYAAHRLAAHWPVRQAGRLGRLRGRREASSGPAGPSPGVERLRAVLRDHFRLPGAAADHLPDAVVRAAIADLLPGQPRYTVVDTACSSSLYAVGLGAADLLDHECDIAVCGGYYMLTPRFIVAFDKLGGLSRSGDVRPFDRHADGTLFSDGAAVVVLKRLADARRDGDPVLGVLAGFGASSDGRGKAIYAPGRRGQQLAIARAHAAARDAAREQDERGRPDRPDWIVAHGTGTAAGDAAELGVLAEQHPGGGVLCTANKALIGHTGWAAGAASLIEAGLGLRHSLVPAQRRHTAPPPEAGGAGVRIPREDIPLPAGRRHVVGVSAFGFGGTNAHLLLTDTPDGPGAGAAEPAAPQYDAPRGSGRIVLVAWSAHLPGEPTTAEVSSWLTSGGPVPPATGFGTPYPGPPAHLLRIPGDTVAAMDRTQLMAIAVAGKFAAAHGRLWAGSMPTTGVVAAHTGPTVAYAEAALRCYAGELATVQTAGEDIDQGELDVAMAGYLAQVRAGTPPISKDTQIGLMGNLIPARIANHLDLNGPAILIDGGPAPALIAVETACGYLHRGDLDLALVLAVNGNSDPEVAALLELRAEPAEGAFLLALARESDARAADWPVVCLVEPRPSVPPSSREFHQPDGRPSCLGARTYLAADGMIELLAAAERLSTTEARGEAVVRGPFPAPLITLRRVPAMRQPAPAEPAPSASVSPPTVPAPAAPPAAERPLPVPIRYASVLTEISALAAEAAPGTAGDDWLVLTDPASADVVPKYVHTAGATVVTVTQNADPETILPGLSPPDRAGASPPVRFAHIRIVGSLDDEPAWPAAPSPGLLALHETLFVAARASRDAIGAGGSLGVLLHDPLPHGTPHPHTGLFTGILNSLGWDLAGCRIATVITDRPPAEAWTLLEGELTAADRSPVTIHHGRGRLRRRLCPAPAPPPGEEPALADDAIVVATGGARGITATCLEAMAARTPLRIWLLGTSDPDEAPAELLAAHNADLTALRADFIAAARRDDPQRKVIDLNRRFDRLLRARESRLTLNRLRARCGEAAVRYLTCDLTDADAVGRAAATIRVESGRPVDLLIHGAGLHAGGDIARLSLPAMRAVRDVKLLGYHNLKQAFTDPPPRRWCNFGSVAGLVGLPGETDYAPANDFLGGAACHESVVRGTSEHTIAWPIWTGTGMGASDVIQSVNACTGWMNPLPPEVGTAHFISELPRRTAAEPLVSFLSPVENKSFSARFPALFADATGRGGGLFLGAPYTASAHRASWALRLDVAVAAYLRDHLVAGRPTIPGTVLAAIAAEAAVYLAPGAIPYVLRDLRFRSFVRPSAGENRSPHLLHAETLRVEGRTTTVLVKITSDVVGRDGTPLRPNREHFKAVVELRPSGDDRPEVRYHADLPAGRKVDDRYYQQDSFVRLSGVFRAADDWHVGPDGATAHWNPDRSLGRDARDLLDRCLIPAVLLDGMARAAALQADPRQEQVPQAMATIELHRPESDGALARRHRDGLTLAYTAADGETVAITSGGIIVARMAGVDLFPLTPPRNGLTPGTRRRR